MGARRNYTLLRGTLLSSSEGRPLKRDPGRVVDAELKSVPHSQGRASSRKAGWIQWVNATLARRSKRGSFKGQTRKECTNRDLYLRCFDLEASRLKCVIVRSQDLANFRLAFPARPVFLVELHEFDRALHGRLSRVEFHDRVPPHNLLRLGERPVK